MDEQIRPIEEIRKLVEHENELNAAEKIKPVAENDENNVEFTLDKSKSYEQQAEDAAFTAATAAALRKKFILKVIVGKKAKELKKKASEKLKKAQADDISAKNEKQKAIRNRNITILQTFAVKNHLPESILKFLLSIFLPIYIFLTISIGIPCGAFKICMDNVENLLDIDTIIADNSIKDNRIIIKIMIRIIIFLGVLATATFILLKCLNKI